MFLELWGEWVRQYLPTNCEEPTVPCGRLRTTTPTSLLLAETFRSQLY